MSEEPHYREFSLVILNAICNLSDEAVYFTCLHTPALSHIVYFLEFTDTAMHSVVTQQGMTALRDSPELMGTSVGMLRRAATLLHSFCRVEECRKLFIKQQQRLLALSMSQLMDSRVAQMIVETLYEVPRAEDEAAATMQAKEEVKKPKKEEERDSPMVTAANDDASSSAASTSSPEHKAAETEEKEEKLTNGTPVSEGSPAPSNDSLFRAPKMKRRPSSPVASLENGSNGDCKKRRRLENGTNGKKLNGSIEVDHTATTKNSMAAVA
uniref:BAF250_C domain-containing protein n=1 Tax=Steinernema glaseri TaxID=37863 RepID=A0A1I7ZRV3_9BILA